MNDPCLSTDIDAIESSHAHTHTQDENQAFEFIIYIYIYLFNHFLPLTPVLTFVYYIIFTKTIFEYSKHPQNQRNAHL